MTVCISKMVWSLPLRNGTHRNERSDMNIGRFAAMYVGEDPHPKKGWKCGPLCILKDIFFECEGEKFINIWRAIFLNFFFVFRNNAYCVHFFKIVPLIFIIRKISFPFLAAHASPPVAPLNSARPTERRSLPLCCRQRRGSPLPPPLPPHGGEEPSLPLLRATAEA